MRTSTVEIQIPDAESVTVTEDTLSVNLSDGRTLEVPPAWFPGCYMHPGKSGIAED
jgi:hypothetical protein